MITTDRDRFSPTDTRKTFSHLDVLWGQMTEGRESAAPVSRAYAAVLEPGRVAVVLEPGP